MTNSHSEGWLLAFMAILAVGWLDVELGGWLLLIFLAAAAVYGIVEFLAEAPPSRHPRHRR